MFNIYIAIHIPSIFVLMLLFLWLASANNVIEHFKSKTSLVSVWTRVEKVNTELYIQGVKLNIKSSMAIPKQLNINFEVKITT